MSKKKNISKTTKVFGKDRVFKAPVETNGEEIIVKFPAKVLEYLNVDADELFWSPVNGVIQISGKQPHMVIPMINIDEDSFLPQGKLPVVEAE